LLTGDLLERLKLRLPADAYCLLGLTMHDLYPGNRWVDWVGFDGFNWAQAGEWNSFTAIVDNTYEEIDVFLNAVRRIAEGGTNVG